MGFMLSWAPWSYRVTWYRHIFQSQAQVASEVPAHFPEHNQLCCAVMSHEQVPNLHVTD